MFSLPNPTNMPTLDGVPFVELHDQWQDIRDLLRLLYGSLDTLVKGPDETKTSRIAGPLRLATKYNITSIAVPLGEQLERDWPDNYADWMRKELEMNQRLMKDMDAYYSGRPTVDDFRVEDPALLVCLAYEVQLHSVTRSAWYELARSYVKSAAKWKPHDSYMSDYWRERRTTDTSILGHQDMVRLLVGREQLRDMVGVVQARIGETIQYGPGRLEVCTDFEGTEPKHWPCSQFMDVWSDVRLKMSTANMYRDFLGELAKMEGELGNQYSPSYLMESGVEKAIDNMCTGCKGWLIEELRDEGNDIWNALPRIFGL